MQTGASTTFNEQAAEPASRRWVAVFAAVMAALLVGLLIGVTSARFLPWGASTARTVPGKAYLFNGGPEAGFEGGGEQFGFSANDIYYMAGSVEGTGIPPCLSNDAVTVEAGTTTIRHPDGGSHEQLVWIRCL